MNTGCHPTFPSSIPIKTRSDEGRTEGITCSKLSRSPKKFFGNRLALNVNSSSCVDLNLRGRSLLATRCNQVFLTPSIPEFPSQVFPSCRSPRRHFRHPHQKRRHTEGGRRAFCAGSSPATIYPTLSPAAPRYPSAEMVTTRVRHTPRSRCFLTVFGSSTCLGTCQSRTASREVSVSLGPTSIEHSQVSSLDAIWTCRAWATVRIWNVFESGSHTKNASPAVTSRNKLLTSSALRR